MLTISNIESHQTQVIGWIGSVVLNSFLFHVPIYVCPGAMTFSEASQECLVIQLIGLVKNNASKSSLPISLRANFQTRVKQSLCAFYCKLPERLAADRIFPFQRQRNNNKITPEPNSSPIINSGICLQHTSGVLNSLLA